MVNNEASIDSLATSHRGALLPRPCLLLAEWLNLLNNCPCFSWKTKKLWFTCKWWLCEQPLNHKLCRLLKHKAVSKRDDQKGRACNSNERSLTLRLWMIRTELDQVCEERQHISSNLTQKHSFLIRMHNIDGHSANTYPALRRIDERKSWLLSWRLVSSRVVSSRRYCSVSTIKNGGEMGRKRGCGNASIGW